ncbi:unnamed protein product [Brassica rapa subsp. trilocularis]
MLEKKKSQRSMVPSSPSSLPFRWRLRLRKNLVRFR